LYKSLDKTKYKSLDIAKEAARNRVNRRDTNQLESERLMRADAPPIGPLSPVETGCERYTAEKRYGNCGEMAFVAIYVATTIGISSDDMILVTARNKNIKKKVGWFSSAHMEFAHSWAQLGRTPDPTYVVDPWAGVVCKSEDYATTLKKKL